jgi:hypothetical protein
MLGNEYIHPCFPLRILPTSLRVLLLVAAFVSLLSVTRAHSWGTKGHEIVAAIAETHLTDTARRRIKELLPQGTT